MSNDERPKTKEPNETHKKKPSRIIIIARFNY